MQKIGLISLLAVATLAANLSPILLGQSGQFHYLGIFLFLLCFSLSSLGWGSALLGKISPSASKKDFLEAFNLGLIIKMCLGFLLAHTGMIGENMRWLFFAEIACGLLLLPNFSEFKKWLFDKNLRLVHCAILIPLLLLLALVALQTLILRDLEEVYIYHLFAPQRWWLAGRAQFDEENLLGYFTGLWDYLHLWAQAFFFTKGDLQLAQQQIFGQLLHGVLAFGLCALALNRILRFLTINWAWRVVALLSALSVETVLWTAFYAKNDFAAFNFLLFALAKILSPDAPKSKREQTLLGIYLGMSVAIKPSSLLYFPLILTAWFLANHCYKIASLKLVVGSSFYFLFSAMAAMGLLGLRNYLATDSPFFPFQGLGFSHSFRTVTYDSMSVSMTHAGLFDLSMGQVFSYFWKISAIEISLLPALLAGITIFLFSKNRNLQVIAAAFIVGAIFAISPMSARAHELHPLRYLSLVFIFSRILFFSAIALALAHYLASKRKNLVTGIALLFALALLSRPVIPWISPLSIRNHPGHYLQFPTPGAPCLKAARDKWPGESFLILFSYSAFLVPTKRISAAYQNRPIDAILQQNKPISERLHQIHQSGYRFIIDTYVHGLHPRIYREAKEFQDFFRNSEKSAIVHDAGNCLIFDLQQIVSEK